MNIRMAAVAVCALTLGATPAAADLFTFETTFTASSNVVQVGETVILDLKIRLVPDYAADAAAGVFVFGMAFPQRLIIFDDFPFDGLTHSRDFILQLNAGYPTPLPPTEFTFAVSYDTPGVYSPFFQSDGELSVRPPGGGIQHLGYFVSGSTQISVIPGPVIGAGVPGLVLAFGGVATWWRRRRYPQRVQLVPL